METCVLLFTLRHRNRQRMRSVRQWIWFQKIYSSAGFALESGDESHQFKGDVPVLPPHHRLSPPGDPWFLCPPLAAGSANQGDSGIQRRQAPRPAAFACCSSCCRRFLPAAADSPPGRFSPFVKMRAKPSLTSSSPRSPRGTDTKA